MWSYYGSKSKVVNFYPKPLQNKIIEPFAGSARYSLKYFENDITLIDAFENITNAWNYLIQASEKDILSLPQIKQGDDLRNFNLTETERFIIYCCCTGGGSGTGQGFTITACSKSGFNSWENDKKRIAKNLYKIRHWKIIKGNYFDIENINCTWFIDPPYMFGGHKYKFSNKKIDFKSLAAWCQNRNGQVIVCENTKADWLPFNPLKEMQGIMFKTTEAIWTNYHTHFNNTQQQLF